MGKEAKNLKKKGSVYGRAWREGGEKWYNYIIISNFLIKNIIRKVACLQTTCMVSEQVCCVAMKNNGSEHCKMA